MRTASVSLVAAAIALGASPAIAQDRDQVRVVFEHALPNVEGKRIVAVTVSYPPGAKSLPHRHAPSAFIYAYVLSGAIRSQVGNDPAKVYHAGEGFYEMPGSHHRISENASEKEPASLLAVKPLMAVAPRALKLVVVKAPIWAAVRASIWVAVK